MQILHTRELESAFFAAGFKIAQNVTGTFTVSAASESAAKALGNSKYDGKLRAYSASFGLSMGQAFARFIHERGKDITLLTEYGRSVQISQDDMNTFLRQTTVTTDTTTTTLWNAFSRETVLGGYTWNIGDNWQVTGSAGLSNDPLHGTMETAGFDVAYFGGDWKANAGIRSQSGQIISNGAATVQLNDKWSLGITGQYTPAHDSAKPNSMVFGVVTYSFDPVRPRYERPWIGQVSSPENQVNIAITNPTLHVQPRSLGEVKEVTTEVVTTDIKDTPNAPQALTESAIQTKINLDRTVTVTFRARSGWNYEYQVDGSST